MFMLAYLVHISSIDRLNSKELGYYVASCVLNDHFMNFSPKFDPVNKENDSDSLPVFITAKSYTCDLPGSYKLFFSSL